MRGPDTYKHVHASTHMYKYAVNVKQIETRETTIYTGSERYKEYPPM